MAQVQGGGMGDTREVMVHRGAVDMAGHTGQGMGEEAVRTVAGMEDTAEDTRTEEGTEEVWVWEATGRV